MSVCVREAGGVPIRQPAARSSEGLKTEGSHPWLPTSHSPERWARCLGPLGRPNRLEPGGSPGGSQKGLAPARGPIGPSLSAWTGSDVPSRLDQECSGVEPHGECQPRPDFDFG